MLHKQKIKPFQKLTSDGSSTKSSKVSERGFTIKFFVLSDKKSTKFEYKFLIFKLIIKTKI